MLRSKGNVAITSSSRALIMIFSIYVGSIATESDYPYQGVGGTCHSEMREATAQIRGFEDVPANNEEQLLQAEAKQPVSVEISVNDDLSHTMEGRVYLKGQVTLISTTWLLLLVMAPPKMTASIG